MVGVGIAALIATQFIVPLPVLSSDWLNSTIYSDYVQSDRVPLPWIPVTVGQNSVHVWGRSVEWSSGSILPSSIKTQGTELLTSPVALVATIGGTDYTVPLGSFTVTQRQKKRVNMQAQGAVQGLEVTADMYMDYDGFLWVELAVDDTTPSRQISSLRVIANLDSQKVKLYQAFHPDLFGFIGANPINMSWNYASSNVNFYHWFGNQDLGIGFTYKTLKNWRPNAYSNYATLVPGTPSQSYKINLIEKPTAMNGQVFEFGIQATPIKPLPSDYHSWVTSRSATQTYKAWRRMPQNVDVVTAFAPDHMPGLNAPYKVSANFQGWVDFAHDAGVASTTIGACPQRFSSQSDEFSTYFDEWKALPVNILKWPDSSGVDQYLNCGKSETLRKWNFYGWGVENVSRFNTEGVYYDGWMAGQLGCNNAAHDHGWVDEFGTRQLEIPALEGREYNRAMNLYLEDHVDSPHYLPETAPARPGFPQYHYYIHSWQFVPSVMGHASVWLTGEEAGYKNGGTFSGKTLGEVYGLAGLYTRCLSTNYGVVNTFYPCIWESGDPSDPGTTDTQTLQMFAWLLPHGVPLGLMDYMNADRVVEISGIMMDFETRKAEFTPAWRANPYIQIASPVSDEVVVGTWAHPLENKVLAVVSNLKVSTTHDVVLNWIGFPNPVVKDARTGEPLTLDNNSLTVNLGPESFVMLSVESGGTGSQAGDTGFLVAWRDSFKVAKYDNDWEYVEDFAVMDYDIRPTAVAQDKSTGDVYIATTWEVSGPTAGAIVKYDQDGNLQPGWAVYGIGYITGLAVRDGKLFVSDTANQTLKWYSTSNSSVQGALSSAPDAMGNVAGMVFDSQGCLFVAAGATVKKWNADLSYAGAIISTANAIDIQIMPGTADALRVLRWDGYVLGYANDGTWTGPYYYTGAPPAAQSLWIAPDGKHYRAAASIGGIELLDTSAIWWNPVVFEEGEWLYPRDIERFSYFVPSLDVTVTLQDYVGDLSLIAVRVDVYSGTLLVASKTIVPESLTPTVSFSLAPGNYTVRASAPKWLTKEASVNLVVDSDVSLSLPNGDMYGNNQVGGVDFMIIKDNFDEAGN